MRIGVFFTGFYHLLKSFQRRSQEQGIIRITQDSEKGAFNPTTAFVLLEDGEEIIDIKTVGKSRQDCALADTISHAKNGGKTVVPVDVGVLVDVDENEESDEDDRQSSLQELSKQD